MQDIRFGDCRAVLQQFIDEGITAQMCVTSPPYYGLRDYGIKGQLGLEQTPEEYVSAMVDTFRLVRDIIADDGVLWLNIGDSYASGSGGKYRSNTPNQGSGLLGGKTTMCTANRNGVAVPPGMKTKDLIGIPWMLAFALRADGWYLRQDIIWHKPNVMPESVTDRCTKAHEYIFMLSKSQRYYFDVKVLRENAVTKPKKAKANALTDKQKAAFFGNPPTHLSGGCGTAEDGKRQRRSVWSINTKPYKGAHFAVFPAELIEPCILAGSRVGDTVLDPFMGSGTTAQVALQHRRGYIGAELNTEYKTLQDARINNVTPMQVASQIPTQIAPQTAAESRA